ncbi:MAG: CPBP family intramembrane glutamic endopeptidase [Thermosynechococcaceae cyanobacterium]
MQTDLKPQPQPWPLWPTLGLSALIIGSLLGVSIAIALVAVVIVMVQNPGFTADEIQQMAESLSTNGLLLAISTLIADAIGIGLIYLFVRWRRSITAPEYLGFRRVSVKMFILWQAFWLLFLGLSEVFAKLFHQSDSFMAETLSTSRSPILLFIAVVIMAPLFEELFFRGFMIPGIAKSRLGPAGAVVITSGVWAAIHLQYNLFFMGVIFTFGLLLGVAHLKTRSIYVPLAMHGLNNLIAFAATALTLQ